MSFDDYMLATQPKLGGSLNLHSLLPHLDFFIMLSSAAGIVGNASQANYAAGGTYQDALARHRSTLGLPAVSIDLGIVKSVGYVASNKAVAERLSHRGFTPLEEAEVLRLIESAIRHPHRTPDDTQVITGLSASNTLEQSIPWHHDKRFAALLTMNHGGGSASSHPFSPDATTSPPPALQLRSALSAASSRPEATAAVLRAIVAKMSDMFMLDPHDVDPALPLTRYGVDSLVAVELRNWLAANAQAEVSVFDVLQAKSLEGLAERVVVKSRAIDQALLTGA